MLSSRIRETNAPPLVKLGEFASQTEGCISLGQGVPYYQPPGELLEEYVKNITKSALHCYTPDPGIIELREALAKKLTSENNITAKADEITVTPGANQAFLNTVLSITDPGDEVILLSPHYFNHKMACQFLNLKPVEIPLNEDFTIPQEQLLDKINERTKAIVFVNPGNPTGAVHTKEDIDVLADILENTNIWLISDETYEYFTYNNTSHISPASNPEIANQCITIGSFSKTYGMPGWRCGYYHGNEELNREAMKVQDTTGICAPAISQYLALELLAKREAIIPKFKGLMETNHKLAKDLLEEVKWLDKENSSGAYYLFPKQTTGKSSMNLAFKIIEKYKVALVPGDAFGSDYSDYFRISFANVSPEILEEAFNRLKSADL
ncbi:MAG: pyridoxal phosphate-dependent aminotransferase [Candidatus Kariarchaeaceae archaeon]|jgi:aspartate/methionine/tyrosine aminotransferase